MTPPPPRRDVAAEMRATIDAETAGAPYISRVVAEHIVSKLRATDPDLLYGWLDEQAEHIVWQAINDRDRSTRAQAKERARRVLFAGAADDHAAGDSQALTMFLAMPFPVADGRRKLLADLTADDLKFVAAEYERRAHENAMTAAFLRAIAKRVGRSTVGKKFTEPQLAQLWTSLPGGGAP
jgi:hypothetical protein